LISHRDSTTRLKGEDPVTNSQRWLSIVSSAALIALMPGQTFAQFATAVVSYNAGATPATGFTTSSSALGSPERFIGEGVFPGIVSPFNPPFLASEIVSVGEGGHLTLRLSHYAIPQAAGPEIGVFENVGVIDVGGGTAGSPAAAFGVDSATVEVSANGTNWVSLGNVMFDIPANGYTDLTNPFSGTAGTVPSDFQKPFTGSLSDFSGLRYADTAPNILDLLAGSGGGKWLDISGTGLPQVGWIRFSVADDMRAMTGLNFELDAVSVSHAALGSPVVPEPAAAPLIMLSAVLSPFVPVRRCRLRRRKYSANPKPNGQHQCLDQILRAEDPRDKLE
jgi:hypothetical protein